MPPGVNPQQTGFNPLLPPGVQPTYQQQPYGQQQGTYPGAPVNSQTGGVSPSFPYSTQPGAQGAPAPFAQPGLTTNPAGQAPGQNQALSLINQILTTPRAGGLAGASQPMAGAQIGPGIAGVASTLERKGIKIYNEKVKYNEWEFIYDLTKDTKGTAGTTGIAGAPQQGGQAQQTQPGRELKSRSADSRDLVDSRLDLRSSRSSNSSRNHSRNSRSPNISRNRNIHPSLRNLNRNR